MDLLKVSVIDESIQVNTNKSPAIQSTRDFIVCCSPIERDFVVCNGESGSLDIKSIFPNMKRKLIDFWKRELKDVCQEFVDVIVFRKVLCNFAIYWDFNLRILRMILDELQLVMQNQDVLGKFMHFVAIQVVEFSK